MCQISKENLSQTTYFFPQLMEEDGKTREKQFIKQNEGTSSFGIGQCELIIFIIVYNGDPHGL